VIAPLSCQTGATGVATDGRDSTGRVRENDTAGIGNDRYDPPVQRGGESMKPKVRIEEVLGIACMVVLVLITLGNVLTRYVIDESFAWTEEISIFLIVVMTLAGAASIAARDGHIRIEFFYDGGTARRRRALRLLSAGATTTLFLVLTVLFSMTLADEVKWSETSMGLGVPRWWFTAAVPPLCLAIALRAASRGWAAWRRDPDAAAAEDAAS
jgi:TRAP-type transport system small permease protein